MVGFVAILLVAFAYLLLIPTEYEKEFSTKDEFWTWHNSNIKDIFLTTFELRKDGTVFCKYRKIKGEKKWLRN